MLLTRQRLRQQRADGQARVVGEPDVSHRATATLGARQPKQPQNRRRHHRGLARADPQPAHDQQPERADERGNRADGHHERAGDDDPRRPAVIRKAAPERTPRRTGQRRRSDREADENGATAE